MSRPRAGLLAGLAAILGAAPARAQVELPAARPVPVMQVIPLPDDRAAVTRDGDELTRYHFGPTLRRTFLFPLIGPSGRSLTRMGHPHDPVTHGHRSTWYAGDHDFPPEARAAAMAWFARGFR